MLSFMMKDVKRSRGQMLRRLLLLGLLQCAILCLYNIVPSNAHRMHQASGRKMGEMAELEGSMARFRQMITEEEFSLRRLQQVDERKIDEDHKKVPSAQTSKPKSNKENREHKKNKVKATDEQIQSESAVKKPDRSVDSKKTGEDVNSQTENNLDERPEVPHSEKNNQQQQRSTAGKKGREGKNKKQEKPHDHQRQEQHVSKENELPHSNSVEQKASAEEKAEEKEQPQSMAETEEIQAPEQSERKTGEKEVSLPKTQGKQHAPEPETQEEQQEPQSETLGEQQDPQPKTEGEQQEPQPKIEGEQQEPQPKTEGEQQQPQPKAQGEQQEKAEPNYQTEENNKTEKEQQEQQEKEEQNPAEQTSSSEEEQKKDAFVFPEPYLLGPPIKDWDEQRASWLDANPHMKSKPDGKPRVLIVTGSQPRPCRSRVGDNFHLKALKLKMDYARMHSYEIYYNLAWLDPLFGSFWVKLPTIRTLMLTHPEIEWFFWVDSDATFTDMLFEPPWESYKGHNMVMWGVNDFFYAEREWTAFNAGVFMIRNCQWTLDLIDKWSPMGPQGPVREAYGKILTAFLKGRNDWEADDQSALAYLMITDEAVRAKVKLVDGWEYMISGWWVPLVDTYEELMEKYHPGFGNHKWPWITHFTGCGPCHMDDTSDHFQTCMKNIDRAFHFADNQVLAYMGFQHQSLDSPDVIRLRNETERPLELLDVNPWAERISQLAAAGTTS